MASERIGILYRKKDYPGLLKRIAVDAVDLGVVGLGFIVMIFWVENSSLFESKQGQVLCAYFASGMVYLGPWKATGIPTLGYLLFGLKIVDMEGKRVGVWRATSRLAFFLFGPINYLVDMFWIFTDSPPQALRDKFSGTYLVRKNAVEVARGPIRYGVLNLMGFRIIHEKIVAEPSLQSQEHVNAGTAKV